MIREQLLKDPVTELALKMMELIQEENTDPKLVERSIEICKLWLPTYESTWLNKWMREMEAQGRVRSIGRNVNAMGSSDRIAQKSVHDSPDVPLDCVQPEAEASGVNH